MIWDSTSDVIKSLFLSGFAPKAGFTVHCISYATISRKFSSGKVLVMWWVMVALAIYIYIYHKHIAGRMGGRGMVGGKFTQHTHGENRPFTPVSFMLPPTLTQKWPKRLTKLSYAVIWRARISFHHLLFWITRIKYGKSDGTKNITIFSITKFQLWQELL